MIFSLQRFLEDFFGRRRLSDPDQYAIKLANSYAGYRRGESDSDFLARLGRIRTKFYRANLGVDRRSLERDVLASLDRQFKGLPAALPDLFGRARVRSGGRNSGSVQRRSIAWILHSFRGAIQAKAVDSFWVSRKSGRLRPRPETIAQNLLTLFISGVLAIRGGRLIREASSGVGYIDLIVMLGTVSHLIELKVQQGKFVGPAQLGNYMANEGRSSGWLVIFDARRRDKRVPIPDIVKVTAGTIHVITIDINPIAPSRMV